MESDNDMDAFMRSTLSSLRVPRSKNFDPVQQTVVSTTSTNISTPPAPLTTPPRAGGEVFGGVPKPPTGGVYVLGSKNGEIMWLATDQCQ